MRSNCPEGARQPQIPKPPLLPYIPALKISPQALEDLLVRMTDLKGALNGGGGGDDGALSSGLGLVNTTSVQLARYPGDGSGYVRHRDTPKTAQDSEETERKVAPHPQIRLLLCSAFLLPYMLTTRY